MRLNPLRTNMTELELNNGEIILFSYQTPVAVKFLKSGESYKTSKWWSKTTTRHISEWFNDPNIILKPQEFFDEIIK